MYTLQNEHLLVKINPVGAEIASIVSKENGKEYLWQADPDIWGSSAPVLFPIIGALKNGSFSYKNHPYQLPKHGIVRHNETMVDEEYSERTLRLSLKWDHLIFQKYPFHFIFDIRFEVKDNSLIVSHIVRNDGNEKMYFSLGGHPAFNCPMNEGEVYEDYYIEFEKEETVHTWNLNGDGLIADQGAFVMDHSNILNLHSHLFDHDALILKDIASQSVSLKSRKSAYELRVDFEGFPYLGIWAKPQAPFVCIEPWQGIADSVDSSGLIEEKEGIMELEPQAKHEAQYVISILG